jgi:hypothetical protein
MVQPRTISLLTSCSCTCSVVSAGLVTRATAVPRLCSSLPAPQREVHQQIAPKMRPSLTLPMVPSPFPCPAAHVHLASLLAAHSTIVSVFLFHASYRRAIFFPSTWLNSPSLPLLHQNNFTRFHLHSNIVMIRRQRLSNRTGSISFLVAVSFNVGYRKELGVPESFPAHVMLGLKRVSSHCCIQGTFTVTQS